MSIKIGSKIEKLNPSDTYKLVDGADVDGFDTLKTQVDQHEADKNAIDSRIGTAEQHLQTLQQDGAAIAARVSAAETSVSATNAIAVGNTAAIKKVSDDVDLSIKTLESDVAQKISGIHVEDVANNAFDDINSLHFIGATVSHDSGNQASVTIDPTFNVSNGQTTDSVNFNVEDLEFPNATITTRNNGKIAVITTAGGATPDTGIIVSAGSTVVTGVKTLQMTGTLKDDTGGSVSYKPTVTVGNIGGSYHQGEASEIEFSQPMEVTISNDNVATVNIHPAAFEPQHAPAFLAYLNDREEIVGVKGDGGHHSGAVWFDDVVYPRGIFIVADMDRKSYGVQGIPATSGTTDYLIAARVHMDGVAAEDGYVRLYLYNTKIGPFDPQGYMMDINGHPMVVERQYKQGDSLSYLDVFGVVRVTAINEFSVHVSHDMTSSPVQISDPYYGKSGILIQALLPSESTSPARAQFELDAGLVINEGRRYIGTNFVSTGFIRYAIDDVSAHPAIPAGTVVTLPDGFGLHAISPVFIGGQNGKIVANDDGTNPADYHIHNIVSAEDTLLLRGKVIRQTTRLTNVNNAYNVALMKWMGKPDEFTQKIITGRNNDSPIFDQNWVKVDEQFIAENPTGGEHAEVKEFTVPADANNIAMIIYPAVAETPSNLILTDFNTSVSTPFTGYAVNAPYPVGEHVMTFSAQNKQFAQGKQGYSELRYSIGTSETPMPCGMDTGGAADITIDSTVNKVVGSQAKGGEGALRFNSEGQAQIHTMVRAWADVAASLTIAWYIVSGDGAAATYSKITESEQSVQLRAGTRELQFSMPIFTQPVAAGERIALRAVSSVAFGVYLQCVSDARPMLQTSITFNELMSTGGGDDPFSGIDMSQFTKAYPAGMTVTKDVYNVASVVIPIDIPDDVNMVVLGAIKEMPDLTVRPVAKLDWSYSNTNKRLTVSFGETVLAGRVTMGLYL